MNLPTDCTNYDAGIGGSFKWIAGSVPDINTAAQTLPRNSGGATECDFYLDRDVSASNWRFQHWADADCPADPGPDFTYTLGRIVYDLLLDCPGGGPSTMRLTVTGHGEIDTDPGTDRTVVFFDSGTVTLDCGNLAFTSAVSATLDGIMEVCWGGAATAEGAA